MLNGLLFLKLFKLFLDNIIFLVLEIIQVQTVSSHQRGVISKSELPFAPTNHSSLVISHWSLVINHYFFSLIEIQQLLVEQHHIFVLQIGLFSIEIGVSTN